MTPAPSNHSGLRFISGIICKSKVLRFERMLFRATRGNMLFNQAPADEQIIDPISNEMVEKIVFVVFFSGEQARTKILKICEAFGANCYPVPEDISKQRQITSEEPGVSSF
ncbi:V-type H+-transporting ATPase subunit I [Vigna unguiculata]|uniref:V-type proton ATPase subunit a n=1 Tax=Vigna unguiculata TaxID=3917 RepID=A0A4D6LIW3_VIGUN|nr:V-type H+-transporting ATPase subunit I [Vigna unguiculata]